MIVVREQRTRRARSAWRRFSGLRGDPVQGTNSWECVRTIKAVLHELWIDAPEMPQVDSSPYFDAQLMAALEWLANRRGGQALVDQLRASGPEAVREQLEAAGVTAPLLECVRQAWEEWQRATGYYEPTSRSSIWWWVGGFVLIAGGAAAGAWWWKRRRA